MRVESYDTERYDFRSPAADVLGALEALRWDGGDVVVDSDQHTPWHRSLYDLYERGWLDIWQRFARDWLRPRFGPGMAYQARPTWRVHPAGNRAVGPWHTDQRYGHGTGTTNVWVPLTDAAAENALWIEGSPVTVNHGEVLIFDGTALIHGNVANITDRARVSFDARIVAIDTLRGGRSFNTRTPLALGGYYEALDDLRVAGQPELRRVETVATGE